MVGFDVFNKHVKTNHVGVKVVEAIDRIFILRRKIKCTMCNKEMNGEKFRAYVAKLYKDYTFLVQYFVPKNLQRIFLWAGFYFARLPLLVFPCTLLHGFLCSVSTAH